MEIRKWGDDVDGSGIMLMTMMAIADNQWDSYVSGDVDDNDGYSWGNSGLNGSWHC